MSWLTTLSSLTPTYTLAHSSPHSHSPLLHHPPHFLHLLTRAGGDTLARSEAQTDCPKKDKTERPPPRARAHRVSIPTHREQMRTAALLLLSLPERKCECSVTTTARGSGTRRDCPAKVSEDAVGSLVSGVAKLYAAPMLAEVWIILLLYFCRNYTRASYSLSLSLSVTHSFTRRSRGRVRCFGAVFFA